MKTLTCLVAVGILGGCHGGPSDADRAAAKTALGAQPWFSTLFPSRPGSVDCAIHGGGPAPGVELSGTCDTEVEKQVDGSVVVRFSETWDRRFTSTFAVSLSRDGTVIGWRQYGEIPPQYWP
jgi:hypothetical protein